MEVTLAQMLEARETRALRQLTLIQQWRKPIVSFSMNIPGPVKDTPRIRRGFRAGLAALEQALPREFLLHREVREAVTGCEAILVMDMEPLTLKAITTKIEDSHPLGRLFDMDVLTPELTKLDREAVGGGSRDCMVCGAPGRGCASRRLHSVEELQRATNRLLEAYFWDQDAGHIGALAAESLIFEVNVTPKPGLVDRRNTGSHRDMDIGTFYASAKALEGYFVRCARLGMETAAEPPQDTFPLLRREGLLAEEAMYRATGGVNTHKGAIFTLGVLCGAAGRLFPRREPEALCREAAAMTRQAMEGDFAHMDSATAGGRLYVQKGIRGIRGEVMEGLPSVTGIALPALREALRQGSGENDAALLALLRLIARVEDTNMLSRGGKDGAAAGAEMAARVLESGLTPQRAEALDDWFIGKNLSPGGCADLLAAAWFLHSLEYAEL